MKRFTFLVCSERSGSNFLVSLLNGHSSISGPPVTHLFRLFVSNAGNYGDLERDQNWTNLLDDVAFAARHTLGVWHTCLSAEDLGEAIQERSIVAPLRVLYEREASHDDATHIVVKENQTYSFASSLLEHFDDVRFLFMVRDPRDVVTSWLRTDGIPGGTAKATETWDRDQKGGWELYRELARQGTILLLRYEDLLTEPQPTLAKAAGFLGLEFEEGMLDSHRARRTQMNAGRIDAWKNLARPIMRTNQGRFRNELADVDQRYVELLCFEAMQRFGYEPELVNRALTGSQLEKELDALRPRIQTGTYVVDATEQAIRQARLEAIDRVLSREPS